MLSGDNISLSAGSVPLLLQVDLQLLPGEIMVILGPNGAGKSSLLSVLSGMVKPDQGSVTLNQQPLLQLDVQQRARQVAMYTQQQPLSFPFTVEEVVAMGCYPLQLNEQKRAERVQRCLAQLELEALCKREYTALSGGEKQRVQVARVLAQTSSDSLVLLLDEPVSEMDLKYQQATMKRLRILADRGIAVACVLHDLNLAAQYADKVTLLSQGAIVASGQCDEVMSAEQLSRLYQLPIKRIEDAGRLVFITAN